MNWMINIFFLLFLTSLTGMIMQFLWLAGAKLCGHKNPLAIYTGLKVVCLSYLIPIVYILVRVRFKSNFYSIDDSDHNYIMKRVLPLAPMNVKILVMILGAIWGIAFLVFLCQYIYKSWKRIKLRKEYRLETDVEILERLAQCQKRLSMKKELKIYRTPNACSPSCTGVFSKIILMPEQKYLPEELDVIFMHELTHIKHHDLELKFLSSIIVMLHCFSIPVHSLFRQITKWSEIKCDILACREGRELFNTKKYYGIILNLMEENENKNSKDFFITALAEEDSDITRRMKYMKQYKSTRKRTKEATIGIMAAVIAISSVASLSIGTASLSFYDKATKHNLSVAEEENMQEGTEEIITDVDKTWDLIEMTNKLPSNEEETEDFYDWTLNSMDTYTIQKIYCEKGSSIKIICYLSESSDESIVVAGIIDSDYTARSITNTYFTSYNFDINESGYYSVFVRNVNSSAENVKFNYYLL